MKTRYLHVGYPKNLSTSLQRDYFATHPELMHLGIGCNGHNLGCVDDDIVTITEIYLRTAKDFIFESKRQWIKDTFDKYFIEAEKKENIKAVGVSHEGLAFNLTPDNVDITVKAKRLHDIFGADTKIIMIIRNQLDVIKSLYNECVRIGYPKTYADYIEYIYMFHDRNYACDFMYDKAYNLYASLFGKENILVIPVEDILRGKDLKKDENGYIEVSKRISNHIGISCLLKDIGHYNQAMSSAALEKTRQINNQKRHNMGNVIFGTVESNRLIEYFKKELGIDPPFEAVHDIIQKRENIGEALKYSEVSNLGIDYSCDDIILERLKSLYIDGNKKLSQSISIDLKSLGYP